MKTGGDNQCCSSSQQTNSVDDGDDEPDPTKEIGVDSGGKQKWNGSGTRAGSFSSDADNTDVELDEDAVGGCGEWTASSDESFMTADEGYDVG